MTKDPSDKNAKDKKKKKGAEPQNDLDPRADTHGKAGGVLNREVFYGGDMIIQQGDEGYRAYFIERGQVEVIVKEGSRSLRVAELGAGALFGEMALINKAPRSASVRAVTETVVTTISRDEIEGRIKGIKDRAIRALINVLAERLRNTTMGQMEQFKNVPDFRDAVDNLARQFEPHIDEDRLDEFHEEMEPLLETMQKILDKYHK